jgi:hypothetical protein
VPGVARIVTEFVPWQRTHHTTGFGHRRSHLRGDNGVHLGRSKLSGLLDSPEKRRRSAVGRTVVDGAWEGEYARGVSTRFPSIPPSTEQVPDPFETASSSSIFFEAVYLATSSLVTGTAEAQ